MADMNEIFGSDSENEEQEEQHEEEEHEEQEEEGEEQEEVEEQEEEDEEHQEEEEVEEEEEEEKQEEVEEEVETHEEDDDDDEIVRKKAPKAADVFGDELADLSEEDDEEEKHSEIDDHQEATTSQARHIHEEEEAEPEQVISIEIPRVKTDLGKEIHFVKLPNFLSVEPRPFDPDTYEDEIPKGESLDEEGNTRVRLKVENTMRWRYEKDADDNIIKQSNARIVKWSDGSLSMYLGNEIFDVYKTFMQGDHNHLFVRQNNVLHGQTVFKTKLTFRPHSTDSMTHRKMTMSLVDRGAKTKKVKILAEMKKNPEYKRLELMKKEEEKLKAASRRQNQQRRIREKSHSKGLTSNYLEDKYHSEEDEMSLNAIKNKFKSRNNNRPIYSSSDESESERKSSKSKKHLNDDDDDEDDDDYDEDDDDNLSRSKKSSSSSLKNKKKKKVVSDDDDE